MHTHTHSNTQSLFRTHFLLYFTYTQILSFLHTLTSHTFSSVSLSHTHSCTHTFTLMHTHTNTYTYTHTLIHTHSCTHAHIHIHTYTHIHTHSCTHTLIHTLTNTQTLMHTHTHTHIFSLTDIFHPYTKFLFFGKQTPFCSSHRSVLVNIEEMDDYIKALITRDILSFDTILLKK